MDVRSWSRRNTHTHTQSIVIIDRLTVKWVASVRETRHQLREAVASKGDGWRRFCELGNRELASVKRGGGVQTVRGQVVERERRRDLPGLRWQLPAAAGKPMDPQRRINFAVNCFYHVRGLARFERRATNREEYLETEEDKMTV